jgi:hypothetical protein
LPKSWLADFQLEITSDGTGALSMDIGKGPGQIPVNYDESGNTEEILFYVATEWDDEFLFSISSAPDTIPPVPLPASVLFLIAGLGTFAALGRRRKAVA